MLTSSSTLPVDTQITHILVSGGRVTAVRSKRKGRTWSHQRHRNFTSAFGGYFAGNYLASFKNKQNAVVLTTFKKDVEHERAASWYSCSSTHAWHCKSIERLSGDCYAVDDSESQAYFQVSQLLSASGLPPVSEPDYKTAVHHSFIVVAAYVPKSLSALIEGDDALKARTAYTVAAKPGTVEGMRLVGFTRAISDGAFTAQITDLVVHPQWQGRGIGRRIVMHLCRQSNASGADGCIVFVKQSERMFFWKSGFRWSGKYRVMKPCDL